ncbi:hypothetical protein P3L10_015421 [Capsicum annuum]
MEQTSDRLIWRMDVLKTFLESCIQEVSLNGRCGSSLKVESWDRIKDVLVTTHNFVATQKKMKNQYDYIKEKYQAWLPLTKKTSNIYDPTTNTIQMSNSEWEEYIKAHPKAKVLKRSPLAFPELCTTLFEGSTATGVHGWSSSCTTPRPGVPSISTNIDGSYGVLKARFSILDKMAPYPINIQRDVIACFVVNNFIRKEHINDELFNQFDTSQVIYDEEGQQEETFEETNGPSWTVEDS